MSKEFRFHPIIEGLKVNEDGSEVIWNDRTVPIKEVYIGEIKRARRTVNILSKTVTIGRLVCECFHGLSPDGDYAATMLDKNKGEHFTNLYWAKRGTLINPNNRRMVTEDDYNAIMKRIEAGETQKEVLRDYPFTKMTFCNYKRKYGKKENE